MTQDNSISRTGLDGTQEQDDLAHRPTECNQQTSLKDKKQPETLDPTAEHLMELDVPLNLDVADSHTADNE